VPLSASTCAGWTALSNIYTKGGQFIKDVALGSCPKILVYDHKFIQTAPSRTLASGIADALAKWYESSITSSTIDDGLVQQAIQISRVLRDQLLIDGEKAFKGQFENNPSWRNTVEACGLTAGLVGGIGGEKCRTAAAHAIHNAITQLITPNKFLHGEIVGVGLLLQLRLEEMKNNNKLADQSIKQLLLLMKELNLPTTIAQLGINVFENNNLEKIADFTCRDKSEIHFLPFEIHKRDIKEVIANFEQQKIKI
jgi:glycerol dehydrogenase